MRHPRSLLPLCLTVFLVSFSEVAPAAITEIRKNFFNRSSNLRATAIMAAPRGDASYLIGAYESTTSCVIVPVLRWTDENGVSRSQAGVAATGEGICYVTLLANIRVQAHTRPTIETTGDVMALKYSLYVSGLGFWPSGAQRQGGLAEVTALLPTKDRVYGVPISQPTGSTSALLVAYSSGYAGNDVPWVSWTDEYSPHTQPVPVGTSAVIPVRIAGGTKVWVRTYPGDITWCALIVFGTPARGAGPFADYEVRLLNWSNATYPNWETVLTTTDAGANILLLSNLEQQANGGSENVGLQVNGTDPSAAACAASLVAVPSGSPASCVSPVLLGGSSAVQFRTYNTPGTPWGPSPVYSAEVDVLEF